MNLKLPANAKLLPLLLLLTGLAHAQTCEMTFTDEGPLIAVVALFSGLLVALAYMASQAFQRYEWELWAKNTGVQVLVAFALVLGVNIVILAGCVASDKLVGEDMFVASTSYLNNLVYSKGFPLIYSLTESSLQNQLEAINFKFTSTPWSGGTGIAKNAGEKTKANAQDAIVNMLMPMISSLYAQKLILESIQTIIIPIFLPMAFVLRIFSQTRTLGDFMIALCIGLGVVFPLTYVMNIVITNAIAADPIYPANIISPHMAEDPDLKLVTVASIIPQAIFLPNLALVITISFIMSFSKLLSRGFEVEAPYA